MLYVALLMGFVGLLLSAVYSGSEIGFYRAARLRLVLDGMERGPIARSLLWLVCRPSLFISTPLLGNNLANYMTSAAVVIATQKIVGDIPAAELIAPLLLTPVIFIFGELLPKHLFLQAPSRMLRRASPVLLVTTVLLAPIGLLLWAINLLLERLVGDRPERLRARIARTELLGAVEEGGESGVLRPIQTSIARAIFAIAHRPVREFVAPVDEFHRASDTMTSTEILTFARETDMALVPIESSGRLTGYYRAIDLWIAPQQARPEPCPLQEIAAETTLIETLSKLQETDQPIALVVDETEQAIGIVTTRYLRDLLFEGTAHAGEGKQEE